MKKKKTNMIKKAPTTITLLNTTLNKTKIKNSKAKEKKVEIKMETNMAAEVS